METQRIEFLWNPKIRSAITKPTFKVMLLRSAGFDQFPHYDHNSLLRYSRTAPQLLSLMIPIGFIRQSYVFEARAGHTLRQRPCKAAAV